MERISGYRLPFGKVYDNTTVLVEGVLPIPYEMGVNIDVFPVDRVPEDEDAWRKYNARRQKFINCWMMKLNGYRVFKWRRDCSVLGNLALTACRIALLFVSARRAALLLQHYSMKLADTDSHMVYECVMGCYVKHPFPRNLFDDLKLTPFEDREYMGFADYDTFLTALFDDWRQLPPKEKQVSHHKFRAYRK